MNRENNWPFSGGNSGIVINVFVKPNEQNDARINSAMARKGRMKSKFSM